MSTLTITIKVPARHIASELAYNFMAMLYQVSELHMLKMGMLKCNMLGPNDEMTYDYQESFDAGITFKYSKE